MKMVRSGKAGGSKSAASGAVVTPRPADSQGNTHETGHGLRRRDFLRDSSMAGLMMMAGAVELKPQDMPKTEKQGDAKPDEKPPAPPVKCAVIGCGVWGREILRTLARLPNAPVTAICDTYEPFLRRAAESAPQAEKQTDYRPALENKAVQAVIVATPTHQHRDIVVAALQAGKHVYCEAPLATTVEDATAIAKAAQAAAKLVFQCGLLFRSNPIHKHVVEFVRTGALGRSALARAQWHKRQSWRRASPNPEREKAANWHLSQATSIGLIGEIGIHDLDTAAWFFKDRPISVAGQGAIMAWNDGREVADTIQAVVEFGRHVRLLYDCTIVNSFDGHYQLFCGSDSAIVIRDSRAWMIKETDAPLLGWEVYARKDEFKPGKDTGISLVANASKLLAQGVDPAEAPAESETPLYYALAELVDNINLSKAPSANAQAGFEATLVAIKANEAVNKGEKRAFQNEWFNLA
jgi:predicted dehydrogenase